jgi:hypothetical protein
MAWSAAEVLKLIGPNAALLVPTLVDALLTFASDSDRGSSALAALARIAPARRDVFERVVEAARLRPPEMRRIPDFPDYEYDAAMHRRGPALESLGEFTAFADEALAVLTDALDTFQEYDPDWGYEQGEHGRVVHSLERLAPASAIAVPSLLRRMRMKDGAVDWRIVRFFGALGPAGHDALPALLQLKAEENREFPEDSGWIESPDPITEPLDWAIMRIQSR